MSPKQRMFVEYYLTCWNASEAARRAGYSGEHNVRGHRLLQDPEIAAAIRERLEEAHMGADEVLERLARQARGSLAPFMRITPAGNVEFDFSTPEAQEAMFLVKKLKTTTKTDARTGDVTQWTEVELYDAQAALALVGKHHRLFVDVIQNDHTLNVIGLDGLLTKVYGGTDNDS